MQTVAIQTAHLGELLAIYSADSRVPRILTGAVVVLIIAFLISLSILIQKAWFADYSVIGESFRRDTIFVQSAICILTALLALASYAYASYHRSLNFTLYEDGFVHSDWNSEHAWRWEEVSEIYEIIRHRNDRPSIPINWSYELYNVDGERLNIGGLVDMRGLGEVLQREVTAKLRPRAEELYLSGGSIRFGRKLSISREGLISADKQLGWDEVGAIDVDTTFKRITINRADGKGIWWRHFASGDLANIDVLRHMLDNIEALNADRSQVISLTPESLKFPETIYGGAASERSGRILKFVLIGTLLAGLIFGGYAYMDHQRLMAEADMKFALQDVCEGQGAEAAAGYQQTLGLHPLMLFEASDYKGSRSWYRTLSAELSDWQPPSLEAAELVAAIEETETSLGNCNFDDKSVRRIVRNKIITLRDARTAEIIAVSQPLEGGRPPACESSQAREQYDQFGLVRGTEVELEQIKAWLAQYVEIK